MNQDTNAQNLYNAAKASLGKHLTLDPAVPPDVGCAEAVSAVLKQVGVTGLPAEGFAGTIALESWLAGNPQFKEAVSASPGTIIISPSEVNAQGVITTHGHVGICGVYGILSNDSDNGLFAEKFTLETWQSYYGTVLGLQIFFFELV